MDQITALAARADTPEERDKLLTATKEVALGQSVYGRLVYRLIAIALGIVAVLVVVFSFVLLLNGHKIDSAFYTLGSAAIGALGGVFAPHGDSATTSASPTTQGAVAQQGEAQGNPGVNQPNPPGG